MSKDSRQLSPTGQKIAVSILCLVFMGVGLGLWIPGFLVPVLDWSERRKWKPVPCTILKSPRDVDGFTLTFKYEYDGTPYEASLDPGQGFFSTPSPLIWTLEAGMTTTCYVNPWTPREVVLKRDFDPELFIWCIPLIFVVLPLFALGAVLFRGARPPPGEEGATPVPPRGSVVLGPESGRGCSLLLQLFFLVFLGGITALIVLLPGFREAMVLRLIYAVPLGIFSILILRGIVRSILRSFSPRLSLTITPGEGCPGREITVRWDCPGAPGGVKRFRLILEGREEAPKSKSAPFAAVDVFEGGTKDFKRGLVKVRLPAGVMPSLTHGSRRIAWVFRLTAQCTVLPDLYEEYPYAVVTGKAGGP